MSVLDPNPTPQSHPPGRVSLTNVSERKDKMRLGMTLASNPKDNTFVVRLRPTSKMNINCRISAYTGPGSWISVPCKPALVHTCVHSCLYYCLPVFKACGPLWSYECGSSYYSTGICSRVNGTFKFSRTIAPAFQSKDTPHSATLCHALQCSARQASFTCGLVICLILPTGGNSDMWSGAHSLCF